MKIVSLNIWAGKEGNALTAFIEANRDADVFCFQEVWRSPRADVTVSNGGTRVHIFDELVRLLPEYHSCFYPAQRNFDLEGISPIETESGQATFTKKGIEIVAEDQVYTYEGREHPGDWSETATDFIFTRILWKGGILTILNFHGIGLPGHKLDIPTRLEQSKRILEFIAKEQGEIVLIGDFNLLPETESIKMIDRSGLRNLISEYGITMTRSKINPYYGTPDQQNFADYAFVSGGITIEKFELPQECVASDHLPMILEFN
jgi:exonuclease III